VRSCVGDGEDELNIIVMTHEGPMRRVPPSLPESRRRSSCASAAWIAPIARAMSRRRCARSKASPVLTSVARRRRPTSPTMPHVPRSSTSSRRSGPQVTTRAPRRCRSASGTCTAPRA
jgi:hypothetical protein